MSTIPQSAIVNITPNVLGTGGSGLDLVGLLLSTSERVPIGTVQAFANNTDVGDYFGPASSEAAAAAIYFGGFDNSNTKPGSVLYAQYNTDDVEAFLRGGSLAGMTLTQLQAVNATLNVTIDGVLKTGTVNLSAATSFSNAALLIADALGLVGEQTATFTASIAATTMTVTAVATGALAVGEVVQGSGVTSGTYITALGSGTGGTGTYTVSHTQTVGSEAMTADSPAVAFDAVTSAFIIYSGTDGASSTITYGTGTAATNLKLTLVTGAVTSQGAVVAAPIAFMNAIAGVTQAWATYALLFDPDNGGNANKLLFAQWTDQQNDRYAFSCWDTDATPFVTNPATSSLGYLIAQAGYSGTMVFASPDFNLAVFACGVAASVDFAQTNGRTTFAFRQQGGLAATCTTQSAMNNLIANGYNFYGAYGTARSVNTYLYDGQISGDFAWGDSFINQIWLNNSFQETLTDLLLVAKSIPYNAAGNAQIAAALADDINAGLNFGAFRAGVILSSSQAAQVNAAAGVNISDTLFIQGWYLQILAASPTVRAARGSPPMTFWYMDGESVQKINMTSVNVQ